MNQFKQSTLLINREASSVVEKMSNTKDLSVLFICIGNSCRSPMAESILKSLAAQHNLHWKIDSAALREWNVGRSPEPRCIKVLAEHNLHSDHVGRQISDDDFTRFDYIFGMDSMNMRYLNELKPANSTAKIELLGKYSNTPNEIIEDPYFDQGIESFRRAYSQILPCCENFVAARKG